MSEVKLAGGFLYKEAMLQGIKALEGVKVVKDSKLPETSVKVVKGDQTFILCHQSNGNLSNITDANGNSLLVSSALKWEQAEAILQGGNPATVKRVVFGAATRALVQAGKFTF